MLIHRRQLKVLSLVVKYLPLFIALMYFLNSLFAIFDIYISAITFFCSCGVLPLLLIYVCCSVLKYCNHYKVYLGYILANDIINWLDYKYEFTENTLLGLTIILGMFFILICYLMIVHLIKLKPDRTKVSKTSSGKSYLSK